MNSKVVVYGVEFVFTWVECEFSTRQTNLYCNDVWFGSVELHRRKKYVCRFKNDYLEDKFSAVEAQDSVIEAARKWLSTLNFKVANSVEAV